MGKKTFCHLKVNHVNNSFFPCVSFSHLVISQMFFLLFAIHNVVIFPILCLEKPIKFSYYRCGIVPDIDRAVFLINFYSCHPTLNGTSPQPSLEISIKTSCENDTTQFLSGVWILIRWLIFNSIADVSFNLADLILCCAEMPKNFSSLFVLNINTLYGVYNRKLCKLT